MLASIFYPITLLAAVASVVNAQQLTLLEPTSQRWWVANSQNTLKWTGTTPTEFSVFINHPDPTVLTSKLALISVRKSDDWSCGGSRRKCRYGQDESQRRDVLIPQPLYEYSKTITPSGLKAATGYVMELTNILNSTDIYVKSESFEIKAVGSTYPPQTTAGASGSATGSASASGSGSAAAASPTGSRAAGDKTIYAGLGGILGAAMTLVGLAGL